MTDAPKPTAQVEPYVDVLGIDGAVEFLLEFGGSDLDFPKRPTANSELAQFIGLDKATALCARMGHARTRVPTSKPWLAFVFRSKGLPNSRIARRLHVTIYTVGRWFKNGPAILKQGGEGQRPPTMPLFPDLD